MLVKKKVAYVEALEARLIKEIRYHHASSRLKLATVVGLAPSTVGIYIDRLVDEGYLQENTVGHRLQQRGRPAQELNLRGEAGCFVGVEFEAENIYAVCIDFAGTVLERHHSKIAPESTADDVLGNLETAIRGVLKDQLPPLLGIGIGVPGVIDTVQGIGRDYRYIKDWKNIPLTEKLHERFKIPIVIENNARATALGNLLFESARSSGNFASLLVRSGVGAGLVIDGEIYRGDSFLAGEVGRIQVGGVGASGPTSALEEMASVQAIMQFVKHELASHPKSILQEHADDLRLEHIIEATRRGDELARLGMQRVIRGLGWLAHVITLVMNPGFIILNGPLNALGEWFRFEVQAALNEYALSARTNPPAVHLSRLNEEAGALGAASLAIDAWKPRHRSPPSRAEEDESRTVESLA